MNKKRAASWFFLVFLALIGTLRAGWDSQLTKPGSVPLSRSYDADYTCGWSGISAGEAHVRITDGNDQASVEGNGRSTGLARVLWRLDATYSAAADPLSLRPMQMRQREVYSGKTIDTVLNFSPSSVARTRRFTPAEKDSGTKTYKVPQPNDLFSAFLQIRSQRMVPGDTYRVVVYPSTAAYLATVKVLGKERIRVDAGSFNSVKCDLNLQRIEKGNKLVPHGKFRRATAWISDDPDRVVLKVEAEIFVGSVWCELQHIAFAQ